MNITFLVNYDLASVLALNYLLPRLHQPKAFNSERQKHRLSVCYTRKSPPPEAPPALAALAAFEQQQLAQLQRPGNRDDLKGFAELRHYTGNRIVQLNAVNGADLPDLLRTAPDLIICIRHMTILREQVIRLPQYGVINLHSGLLPAYQGVMASFRAIQNGDSVLGTTLHYIEDRKIDTGAIIAQTKAPCSPDKSYLWNVLNLYKPGCATIIETINAVHRQRPAPRKTQIGTARYFSFPDNNELQRFADAGHCLYRDTDLDDFKTIA